MKKNLIKILITGGTIDNLEYSAEKDTPKNNHSLIPSLLKQSRVTADVSFEVLMQKDSKFVTEEDRKFILRKCQEAKENMIVITYGTMTMSAMAQFLSKANLNKTIVLLGAAIPGNRENSDALFNLGSAMTAIQLLPQGVYITMNGKVFSAGNVKKNLTTGFFEDLK